MPWSFQLKRFLTPFRIGVCALAVSACTAVVDADEVSNDGLASRVDSQSEQFFERKIRPLLVDRCIECHGPSTQESDFRLDSRTAILAGGASGMPGAVPGDIQQSLLIKAVERSDDLAMPPEDPLLDAEITLLRQWIQSGMVWPNTDTSREPTTMAERLELHVSSHWAYQPIRKPNLPIPSLRTRRNQTNETSAIITRRPLRPLDTFVRSKLAEQGLEPSPAADRRTLIRRLAFDLTGLPPTAKATAEFVADDRAEAYESLVDRFLSSPSYGERWGRHWLDVARYADTRGYSFGRDRRYPFAYTYRDYVIRAFNRDLPYDRFVVEQLAADQIQLADRWPLAALGFLTVGRKYNNKHDDIDDKIDVVTRGLLGVTVACARCHDHKYDAIPTEDYYALYGVFGSCSEPNELPLIGEPANIDRNKVYLAELKRLQKQLDQFVTVQHAEILEHARLRVTEYLVALAAPDAENALVDPSTASFGPAELRPKLMRGWFEFLKRRAHKDHPTLIAWSELVKHPIPAKDFAATAATLITAWQSSVPGTVNPLVLERLAAQSPQSSTDVAKIYGELLVEVYAEWKRLGANDRAIAQLPQDFRQLSLLLFDDASPTSISKTEIDGYIVREFTGRYAELRSAIDAHQANAPPDIERAMVVHENRRLLEPHVFQRGDPNRKGVAVPRRYPAAIHMAEHFVPGRERFLAIPSPDFVDGSGRLELALRIASRSNPLTARVFVNRVWMHHFGRPLVSTPSDFGIRSTRPQHAALLDYLAWYLMEHDWSVKSLHREIVLSATYRQSSIARTDGMEKDPENELVWRMNRRRLEFEPLRDSLLDVSGKLNLTMGGRSVNSLEPPYPPRRSVYSVIDRQDLPNLLRAFDLASPDQSAERRAETTVPQQALFLLNSPFVVDLARSVAKRILGATMNDARELDLKSGVHQLYWLLFQRAPRDEEMQVAQRLLCGPEWEENALERSEERWTQLAQVLMLTNEFCFVD